MYISSDSMPGTGCFLVTIVLVGIGALTVVAGIVWLYRNINISWIG